MVALLLALLAARPCTAMGGAGADAAVAPPACGLAFDADRRAVTSIVDGETLRLDDGREVRLIGALAPRAPDATADAADSGEARSGWPPEAEARAALERLALGRSVRLGFAGPRHDRYGRLLAHVLILGEGGGAQWLQGVMLAAGRARAYGVPGSYACADALLAAEAHARQSRAGLWSNDAYRPRPAHRSRELLRLAGTFQLIEGRVLRATRVKERIYVNFGRDWREDFSLAVAPELARSNPAWAAGLLDLAGRRVRVRGWITRRNGPLIEIEDASQIEVLDASREPQSASDAASE
jgi:endonuclease YncB( thermonuclease family)